MKKPKKDPAVTAAARALSARQLVTMTPKQRRERGRNAIAARKDRLKPWHGLLVFPPDYKSQGVTKDAIFLVDAMHQDPHPYVTFWSQDRDAVKAEALKLPPGRMGDIITVPLDPHKFQVIRNFKLNVDRARRAVQTVLDSEGGQA